METQRLDVALLRKPLSGLLPLIVFRTDVSSFAHSHRIIDLCHQTKDQGEIL
jgi:hypothetical protein